MKTKILFVVNVDWFFLSHRLPVALAALQQGYEVHIATGITDKLTELQSHGFIVHPLAMARGRAGFKKEFAAFSQIVRLFWQLKPDLVHLVTIKPVLFGGIAARLTRVHAVVAAISGLGFVYAARGARATLKRLLVGCLYRLALKRPNLIVIVQNSSDRDCLARITGLPSAQFRLIHGSGVDLGTYAFTPLPAGVPVVLMACRLIADKGVWEFVEAAQMLHTRGVAARFQLAGAIDPDNPMSLSAADLQKIAADDNVELLGQRNDMQQVLAAAHVAVLPSYYGEGLPKALIEAAACGRAVITTDMPGCRDAIEPGVTGRLIPPRDAQALAAVLDQLLKNPQQCEAMGKAGRALAEREFDIHRTVNAHLQIYSELLHATP